MMTTVSIAPRSSVRAQRAHLYQTPTHGAASCMIYGVGAHCSLLIVHLFAAGTHCGFVLFTGFPTTHTPLTSHTTNERNRYSEMRHINIHLHFRMNDDRAWAQLVCVSVEQR